MMKFQRKEQVSRTSSLLVSSGVIVGTLLLALVANWFGYALLGVFLLVVGVLGLISRLWGLAALDKVTAEVEGSHPAVFAGEKLTLRYRVKNGKLLPLMWLELCQDLPLNGCVAPEGGLALLKLANGEEEETLFRQSVAFLMGWQELEWERVWETRRRGVYQIARLTLRAGDGFGLTHSSRTDVLAAPPTLVVWPRLVKVDAGVLLRNLWNGQSGGKGYYEDVTLLKGTRAYQENDSWKRIDWRMAARQEELQVKLYETVLPRTIHFVVDGASFQGLSPENDELEEALSILGSLLVELDRRGVSCGLSLPKTGRSEPVNLFGSDREIGLADLLFQISNFDGESAASLFQTEVLSSLQNQVGRIFFLTHSGERTQCRELLRQLDPGLLTALVWQEDEGITPLSGCARIRLGALKEGEQS